LLPVARVDAGRAHGNPDLAGTRMRIGEIHDLEDLRAPEPAETDCLHHPPRLDAGYRACCTCDSLPASRARPRPPGGRPGTQTRLNETNQRTGPDPVKLDQLKAAGRFEVQ